MDELNLREPEDLRSLIARAKAGDGQAFGSLYERYFTPVYRYIYARTHERATAEDLAQVVFTKAFQAFGRYEDRGKDPLAYLFTVARNTVVNHWRSKREVPLGEDEAAENIPWLGRDAVESAVAAEARRTVTEALRKLTDEQADVLSLKFLSERSTREIAELLGKSEAAVRQLQSRALRALRRELGEYGGERSKEV